MRLLVITFILLSFELSGQSVGNSSFKAYMPGYNDPFAYKNQFELSVYSSDFSRSLTLRYELSERNLKVIFIGMLEGEKDSLIYFNNLIPKQISKKITSINVDNLNEYYSNPCIGDGSQIVVDFNTNAKKRVQLSNFYQKDIGNIIGSINSLVPKKYTIWYDKKVLLRDQEDCR